MNFLRNLLFFVLVCFQQGCSSSVEVSYQYHSTFNFSDLESYSTYERDSAFSQLQNISDVTRNSIELAIENILDKKGYRYLSVENADIVVTYHLVNHKVEELERYNKGVKYCHFCLQSNQGRQAKNKWLMSPGSLIVDFINIDTERTVWRSVYPLNIKMKDNSVVMQEKITEAIESMMKQFPHQITAMQTRNN